MRRLVVCVHANFGTCHIDVNVELKDASVSWELVVHNIVQSLSAHTGSRNKDTQLTFRYVDDEGDLVTVSSLTTCC
jgi:hypothetical protein